MNLLSESHNQICSKLKVHLYLPTDAFIKISRLIYFVILSGDQG